MVQNSVCFTICVQSYLIYIQSTYIYIYIYIYTYIPRSLSLPIIFEKYRDSIKRVVTMAKIQSAREAHINI